MAGPRPTSVTLENQSATGQQGPKVNAAQFTTLQIYQKADTTKLVTARFGDGTITTTGGGAGWVAVPKPQQRVLTAWRGPQDGYQHEIPLILDLFRRPHTKQNGPNLEQMIGWLEFFSGVDMFGQTQPPQLIIDSGGALPHDGTNSPALTWIIPEEPVWGEAIRDEKTGVRIRQLVTVKFMVYHAPDEVTRTVTHTTGTRKTYTAKKGDTWNKIAAKELRGEGGKKWGNRLAVYNGARDGASSPKVGQTVKIPTAKTVKTWTQSPRR